jgi:glyoxylate reductase
MRPSFLITMPLPEPAGQLLAAAGHCVVLEQPPTHRELADACASGDFDVVLTQLTDRIDAELLRTARIGGVSNYATGVDNIDLDAASRHGVLVTNTPDVLTEATADIALLLILATARRCVEADGFLRGGYFHGWRPGLMLGTNVSGARLGLVGMGRIARATAHRALGFGMAVSFAMVGEHSRVLDAPDLGDLAGKVTQIDLSDLLAGSDFVSIHVPLAPQTRHLFDDDAFARMRTSAILINTARGPIVDEAALVRALRAGQIAGAGLDVYEDEPKVHPELLMQPNTTLLPHIGSATTAVRSEMARLCALNAISMAYGEAPPHLVTSHART